MRKSSNRCDRPGETSPLQAADVSPSADGHTSPAAANDNWRLCHWCKEVKFFARRDARFCSRRCRQSAFRIRRRHLADTRSASPLRVAYADPPYPGKAAECYKDQPSFAGEVDHAALIVSLEAMYDGWALSTGAYALREVLPLCPAGVRVCAWVKPIGVSSLTFGLHNSWEALIVSPARRRRPGKRDWFSAQPARGGGKLMGRKPLAFCAFLFDALGMLPGDSLEDLFPGTGIVSRAWEEVSRTAGSYAGVGDTSSD